VSGARDPSLATGLCGIPLRNPVIAASGTFAYGVEFERLLDLNALGGLVVKGLSREPIEGNLPPRVWEAPCGMVNSIGLQNIGVRAFVQDKLPSLARLSTPVFANVFGFASEDYTEVVRVIEDHPGVAGYELNVSCPNTKHGGTYFSSDPALLGEVVTAARRVARWPLMVKLSPNVAAIEPLAQAAEAAGADAISLVNTFVALAIDARSRRSRIGAGFVRALRPGHQAHRAAAGLPSGPGGAHSGGGAGRHRNRRRCGGVPHRRRHRRRGRHSHILGPSSPHPHCPRAGRFPAPRRRPRCVADRWHARAVSISA